MTAAYSDSPQSPGSAGAFASAAEAASTEEGGAPLHGSVRSGPPGGAPVRPSTREQLQRLEAVARQELRELQLLAGARPSTTAPLQDLGIAWDLGLLQPDELPGLANG